MTTHPSAPTDTAADAVGRVLARTAQEFASGVDVPVWSLDGRTLDARIGQAIAVRAAADELLARLVGEAEERHLARQLGAASTQSHLVGAHRMSTAEAGRVTRAARQLHGSSVRSAVTEPVRRAQAEGRVSGEQAVVIATAVNRLSPEISIDRAEAAQADLVRFAGDLPYDQLRQAANHLVEVVDPDGADEALGAQLRRQERDARGGCELTMTIHADGSSHGRWGHMPAVATAIMKKALDACTSPRHTTVAPGSLELAPEPLDRRIETALDEVPYANRLGRAFAELIEHLPTDALPQHAATSPHVVITLDEHRLRTGLGAAMIDAGVEISAGEARRLACNAGILPAVLDGDSHVLDLGRTRRLFDRHQRLALALRDRGCVFPRCGRPPSWCEAHHLTPWSKGGSTDLSDGVLLCSFHHHLIHDDEWQLRIAADGVPEAIPPRHVDPNRHPVRHTRFRPRDG